MKRSIWLGMPAAKRKRKIILSSAKPKQKEIEKPLVMRYIYTRQRYRIRKYTHIHFISWTFIVNQISYFNVFSRIFIVIWFLEFELWFNMQHSWKRVLEHYKILELSSVLIYFIWKTNLSVNRLKINVRCQIQIYKFGKHKHRDKMCKAKHG